MRFATLTASFVCSGFCKLLDDDVLWVLVGEQPLCIWSGRQHGQVVSR